jgi:hypothetical protein
LSPRKKKKSKRETDERKGQKENDGCEMMKSIKTKASWKKK